VTEYEDDDDFISKSQLKREAEAAQVIGERLITLKMEQLQQLDLSDTLLAAVIEAKRLTSNGAIRRQKQYIGKLMQREETAPIEAKLAEWDGHSHAETARLHQLERWRDRLLADDQVIGELMKEYPQADAQYLRTLIRNARKEHATGKPPKSSRELFKAVRDLTAD
jgi:ribosome-associated protein